MCRRRVFLCAIILVLRLQGASVFLRFRYKWIYGLIFFFPHLSKEEIDTALSTSLIFSSSSANGFMIVKFSVISLLNKIEAILPTIRFWTLPHLWFSFSIRRAGSARKRHWILEPPKSSAVQIRQLHRVVKLVSYRGRVSLSLSCLANFNHQLFLEWYNLFERCHFWQR